MKNYFSQQDILLTTEELAEKTGMTPRFWEARRLTGDSPPFIRLGQKAVRYRWEDVSKWLADRTFTNTSNQNNGGIK